MTSRSIKAPTTISGPRTYCKYVASLAMIIAVFVLLDTFITLSPATVGGELILLMSGACLLLISLPMFIHACLHLLRVFSRPLTSLTIDGMSMNIYLLAIGLEVALSGILGYWAAKLIWLL